MSLKTGSNQLPNSACLGVEDSLRAKESSPPVVSWQSRAWRWIRSHSTDVHQRITGTIQKIRDFFNKLKNEDFYQDTIGEKIEVQFPFPKNIQEMQLFLSLTEYQNTSEGYYYKDSALNASQWKALYALKENWTREGTPNVNWAGGYLDDLLKHCQKTGFRRQDFSLKDYQALGRLYIEQLKTFSNDLTKLFNCEFMKSIFVKLQDEFGLDYREALIAEVLSRTLAYGYAVEETVFLPARQEDDSYTIAEYQIKPYRLGEQLPCYVLQCKTSRQEDLYRPWFVARGTDINLLKGEKKHVVQGKVESVLADFLNFHGVGEGVVEHRMVEARLPKSSKEVPDIEEFNLVELFNRFTLPINLAGHSLGGNLINQITALMPDKVNKAYAFGAPGVSSRMGKIWDAQKNRLGEELDKKICNIQVQGDAIAIVGKRLIGTHFAYEPLTSFSSDDIGCKHVAMNLNRPFTLSRINQANSEESWNKKMVEIGREKAGGVFRIPNKIGLKKHLPDWYTQRKKYLTDPSLY